MTLEGLAAEKSLNLIPLDLSASQTMVRDTLSEDDDEEISPLFEQECANTDYDPDLSPDKHVRVASASASFPSEDALWFHDLLDQMLSTVNLPSVSVEGTSHSVFDILRATSKSRMLFQSLMVYCSLLKFCKPRRQIISSAFGRVFIFSHIPCT